MSLYVCWGIFVGWYYVICMFKKKEFDIRIRNKNIFNIIDYNFLWEKNIVFILLYCFYIDK